MLKEEGKGRGKTVCKNIFKNGDGAVDKKKFTKLWIDIINKAERNKDYKI